MIIFLYVFFFQTNFLTDMFQNLYKDYLEAKKIRILAEALEY